MGNSVASIPRTAIVTAMGFGRIARLFVAGMLVSRGSAIMGLAADDGKPLPSSSLRTSYTSRRFTTDDGLPQTRVACIAQTPNGYLWFGTWFGLARFDGLRFVVFNQYNTPAFGGSDSIRQLAVDESGVLWFATGKAVLRQTPDGFTEVPCPPGWGGAGVGGLIAARGGGVWVSGGDPGRVLRISGTNQSSWQLPPYPDGSPGGALRLVATDGPLPFLFRSGDSRELFIPNLSGEGVVTIPVASGSFSRSLGQIHAAGPAPGGAWITGSRDLTLFGSKGDVIRDPLPDAIIERGIKVVSPSRKGGLWILDQRGGLWHWSREGTTAITSDLVNLDPAGAESLYEDLEGSLWVTGDRGLIQLRPRIVESFTTHDGLYSDETWSVSPAADGGVWVAGHSGLVDHLRNGVVTHLTMATNRDLGSSTLKSILQTSKGSVFVTGDAGVHRYDAPSWRMLPATLPLGDALYEDHQDRIWAGGTGGVEWIDGGTLERGSRYEGVPAGMGVRTMLQSTGGILWFGLKGGGVMRLDESSGARHFLTKSEGLASTEVWTLHETQDGTLWIGGNRGLAWVDARDARRGTGIPVFSFRQAQGVPEGPINWILEDRQGTLWFSGLRGIHRASPAHLSAVARGQRRNVPCATYGVADGMGRRKRTASTRRPDAWMPTDSCGSLPARVLSASIHRSVR